MRDKNQQTKRMTDEHVKIALTEIKKRRTRWTLISIDFDDIIQMVMLRIIKKYHKYSKEKSEFSHWSNRVISNCIRNILRDNYTKYSRPCILGCCHSLGGTSCAWTQSGTQCAECPLYRKWQQNKQDNFNVNQALSLENHIQEVHSIQVDSVPIDESKKIIDVQMKNKLNNFEYDIYKSIFIDEKDEKEVVAALKAKGCEVQIRKLKEKFVNVAREIILQEDLVT